MPLLLSIKKLPSKSWNLERIFIFNSLEKHFKKKFLENSRLSKDGRAIFFQALHD